MDIAGIKRLVSREAISYILLKKKISFEEQSTGNSETITITQKQVLSVKFEQCTDKSKHVQMYQFG